MALKEHAHLLFTQATQASIAARIRKLRKSRGWTLAEVEKRSHGQIKAVVLGSYERGDRSMNIERAIEIANLFGIPLSELLNEPADPNDPGPFLNHDSREIVIDLRKTKSLHIEERDSTEPFSLFLTWIIGLRQDWNGEILSLRKSDMEILSLMMFKSPESVFAWLSKYQLLISKL